MAKSKASPSPSETDVQLSQTAILRLLTRIKELEEAVAEITRRLGRYGL